jgi:hypothetical protein
LGNLVSKLPSSAEEGSAEAQPPKGEPVRAKHE